MRSPYRIAGWVLASLTLLGAWPGLADVSLAADAVGVATDPTTSKAPESPAVPEPPEGPEPPALPKPKHKLEVSGGSIVVRSGEVHKGDLFKIAPSVRIDGTVIGDVYLLSPSISITGTVDGDVQAGGTQLDIAGHVTGSVRVFASTVSITGTVDDNVQIFLGTATDVGEKAHIKGNLSCLAGNLVQNGVIGGSLTFKGGTLEIGGKILGDADVEAHTIGFTDGARVDGDLSYESGTEIDELARSFVGGAVVRGEPRESSEHPDSSGETAEADDEDGGVSKFGIGAWLAFFTASFLFGCMWIALFREYETKVVEAIRTDALRSAGIGFVSVLVTIAVSLSVILLVTIPFVLIYWVLYLMAWYFARVPVAIWLGRLIFQRLGRPSNPYLELATGLLPMYLLWAIPVVGVILHWVAVPLLGLGAMITTYIAIREQRKLAAAAVAASSTAAQAS